MVVKACKECRVHKIKCRTGTSTGPGAKGSGACLQCQKKGIECSLAPGPVHKLPLLPKIGVKPNNVQDDLALPPLETLMRIVDSYFLYMHDQPHSLFHPTTLVEQINAGKTSQILLHALIGVAGRFTEGISYDLCNKHYIKAKKLLLMDVENVCLENVQACILIVCTSLSVPDFKSEAIFYGLAVRLAQILQLSSEDLDLDPITRETRRRIWWSLYMMDSWSSGGLDLPRLIQAAPYDFSIKLPLPEFFFKTGSPSELELDNKHGLWEQMIKLAYIYRQIQDFNKGLVAKSVPELELESTLTSLSTKLDTWLEELPTGMKLNETNFVLYQNLDLARPFVALHLGYHHYATLLYFQFLDEAATPSFLREPFAARCIFHAESFSTLLSKCFDNGLYLLYSAIGQMTIVSSSVILHRLLFSDSSTVEIRKKLESNFSVLITLRKYWRGIDITIARLQVFQNACKLLMDGAYKMDKWMLTFLLQYSSRMGEKTDIESFFSENMQIEKLGDSPSTFLTI